MLESRLITLQHETELISHTAQTKNRKFFVPAVRKSFGLHSCSPRRCVSITSILPTLYLHPTTGHLYLAPACSSTTCLQYPPGLVWVPSHPLQAHLHADFVALFVLKSCTLFRCSSKSPTSAKTAPHSNALTIPGISFPEESKRPFLPEPDRTRQVTAPPPKVCERYAEECRFSG